MAERERAAAGKEKRGAPPRLSLRRAQSASAGALVAACEVLGWEARRAGREASSAELHWLARDAQACDVLADPARRKAGVAVSRMAGAHAACAKAATNAALARARALCPGSAIGRCWPESYELPAQAMQLREAMRESGDAFWIVKPDAGAHGDGIFLSNDWERVLRGTTAREKSKSGAGDGAHVVQRYVADPALLEGKKFDLRLYVLLTRPPGDLRAPDCVRAYLCREGLVRVCASEYAPPREEAAPRLCAHLTNYSLNKSAGGFELAEGADEGSKRSLSSVLELLAGSAGGAERVFHEIAELASAVAGATCHSIAAAELLAPWPHSTDVDSCFQVLGMDVLLDSRLKPWLLELNAHPSLAVDAVVPLAEGVEGIPPGGTRPCRCKEMLTKLHYHLPSPVDMLVKRRVLSGALEIVRRERRGLEALGGEHGGRAFVPVLTPGRAPAARPDGEGGPAARAAAAAPGSRPFELLDTLYACMCAVLEAAPAGGRTRYALSTPRLRRLLERAGVLCHAEVDVVLPDADGGRATAGRPGEGAVGDAHAAYGAFGSFVDDVVVRVAAQSRRATGAALHRAVRVAAHALLEASAGATPPLP